MENMKEAANILNKNYDIEDTFSSPKSSRILKLSQTFKPFETQSPMDHLI
jgi:hypothetical protein